MSESTLYPFYLYAPLVGHDEDAQPVANDKILIVCDGLGGAGQNVYEIEPGVKHTSAYLGSRKVMEITESFFAEHYDDIWSHKESINLLMDSFKKTLKNGLDEYVISHNLVNLVRGKSMKMLPTTLETVVYHPTEEGTEVLVITSGDSRAFCFTHSNGLVQISKDDVLNEADAYEKSSTMTNCIQQDSEFYVNYGFHVLPKECMIFVCSDGCFDYLDTPMLFEKYIATSYQKCLEIKQYSKIGDVFGLIINKLKCHQDDCTIAGVVINPDESPEGQNNIAQRIQLIQTEIIDKSKSISIGLEKKWEEKKHLDIFVQAEEKRQMESFQNVVIQLCKNDCLETPENIYPNITKRLHNYNPYSKVFRDWYEFYDGEMEKLKQLIKEEAELYLKVVESYKKIKYEYEKKIAERSFSFSSHRKKYVDKKIGIDKMVKAIEEEVTHLRMVIQNPKSFDELCKSCDFISRESGDLKQALNQLRLIKNEVDNEDVRLKVQIDTDAEKMYLNDQKNGDFEKYSKYPGYDDFFNVKNEYDQCRLKIREMKEYDDNRIDNRKTEVLVKIQPMITDIVRYIFDDEDAGFEEVQFDWEAIKEKRLRLRDITSEICSLEKAKRQIWLDYKNTYEEFKKIEWVQI